MYTIRFELGRDAIRSISEGDSLYDPTHLIEKSAKHFSEILNEEFHIENITTQVVQSETYIELKLDGPAEFTIKLQKALAFMIEEDVCENYFATFADIVEDA